MGKITKEGWVDPRKISPEERLRRFFLRVKKTDSCWIWLGPKMASGYGNISLNINGKRYNEKAHRYSYLVNKGDLIKGMVIMHSCDNPSCVNPDHLTQGTVKENIHDCIKKGRRRAGYKPKDKCRRGHDKTIRENVYKHRSGTSCRVCSLEWYKKMAMRKKLLSETPCIICKRTPTDSCHIRTQAASGINKDYNLIQMCREHHREQHQIGIVTFTKKYPSVELGLKDKGWEVQEIFGQMKLIRV